MAGNNPIKYSEFIKPDNSVSDLILQLENLSKQYEAMMGKLITEATKAEAALKKVRGVTESDQALTKKAITQAEQLANAKKKLNESLTDNAKKLALVKLEQTKANALLKLTTKLNSSVKGSYDALSAQYSINKLKLNAMSEAQRKTTASGKALVAQTKQLYTQMEASQLATGKAQLSVGKYGNALAGLGSKLLGSLGVVGGVASFVAVMKSSLVTISNYSAKNSELASILGTTKDGIDGLIASSQAYGRATQFTAIEVAALQVELGKLGFKQQEIEDSTEAVLNLAAATGSELGESAKVAGAALRAMGLDAAEMDRVSSVLAVSTTKTALSFADFNGNLSTILPVAKAFGFSIEDSVALLGKLRDAGFDASSAATATRNILLNLADANGKLAKTIGGSVNNFDDMIDALIKLDGTGLDLGETFELTDKRSVAAFNQFLTGAESARTLRNSLIDVNDELREMVDVRNDNLLGSLELLGSAWDGQILKLKESEGFLQSMVNTLTGWITTAETAEQSAKRLGDGTVKSLKASTSSTEEYIVALELASEKQLEIIEETQKAKDSARLQTTFNEEAKRLKSNELINVRIREELIAARVKLAGEEAAKRLDLEGKSTAALLRMQKSYASFSSGEMKKQGDLILPLIQAQLDERERIEKEAAAKRAKNERDSAKGQTAITVSEMAKRNKDVAGFEQIATDAKTREYSDSLKAAKAFDKEVTQDVLDGAERRRLAAVEVGQDYDLYSILGLNLGDDAKDAISTSTSFAMDQLGSFLDAKVQAADVAVASSEREVDAAQSALDNEIANRAAGYASNVTMAQKELDLAKKNQAKALKEQEKAQKAQLIMDSVVQASGLVTASAKIWGQLGFPWAIPALAVMWGSFALSKVQAAKATKQKTEYAEGGVDIIGGGSHASGNDTLIRTDDNTTERRVEAGEAFAVIRKSMVPRYKKMLPSIIGALNKGTFEQKYMQSYDSGSFGVSIAHNSSTDVSGLERDVSEMRKQGERKYFVDGKGRVVETYKNLKRTYNA